MTIPAGAHINHELDGDCDGDGYHDEDNDHDGFYDDDEDRDGYHDDDRDQDGRHDDDEEEGGDDDDNDDDRACTGGASPTPAPTPTPTPLVGQALYSANCSGCHSNPARFAGISAAGIEAAIVGVPSMSSLSTLSAQQVQAIADYLATL